MISLLNATHYDWETQVNSSDAFLDQALEAMKLYEDTSEILNGKLLVYNSQLLELSDARNIVKAREAEFTSASNNSSEKNQQWIDAINALDAERENTFQICLSEIAESLNQTSSSSNANLTSRKLQLLPLVSRQLQNVCDCTPEEIAVAQLQADVMTKEAEVAAAETRKINLENDIVICEQEEEILERELNEAVTELTRAINEENIAAQAGKNARAAQKSAANALSRSMKNVGWWALGGIVSGAWFGGVGAVAGFGVGVFAGLDGVQDAAEDFLNAKKDLEKAEQELKDKKNETNDAMDNYRAKLQAFEAKRLDLLQLRNELIFATQDLLKCQRELKALTDALKQAEQDLRECLQEKSASDCDPTYLPPSGNGNGGMYLYIYTKFFF